MRGVGPLFVVVALSACAETGDSTPVQSPSPERSSARRAATPRSEYATCVVGLRGISPAPGDFAAERFEDARGAEARGDLDGALDAYARFVEDSEGSALIPYAYFALGALHARRATADPDHWIMAERAFTKVPFYSSVVAIPSNVELARVFNARSKWTDTLSIALRTAEQIRAEPAAPCAELALAELSGLLTAAYVETGSPSQAFVFFRRFAGADRLELAMHMTEELAHLYDGRGDFASANEARSSASSFR